MNNEYNTLPIWIRTLRATGLCRGPLRRMVLDKLVLRDTGKPFQTTFFGQPVVVWVDNITDQKVLTSSRPYDIEEISFLASHLPSDGIFVDVGANSGLISVGVRAKKPHIRSLAIEPNPIMAQRAKKNLVRFSEGDDAKCQIIQCAVSDADGEIFLDLSSGYGTANISGSPSENSITVQTRRFIDILNGEGLSNVDALKIDIEGHEEIVVPDIVMSLSVEQLPKAIVMEKPDPGNEIALSALKGAGYHVQNETRANLLMEMSR